MSETRGPEFRWMESGDGECVLFLHGLMGEMDHWEPSLETLAHVCRPMALALPVFDPALGEASIAELGRHVVRFLDAIEISRAVVGGNSLGGHVALEVALSHPDRVAGLILTGSSGLFERGFTRNVPHCPTTEYVRQKMEEVFYDPGHVTQAWVEAVRKVVTTRATALRVLRFAQAAKRHNIELRLPEIRVPTLIVWGKDDRITPPDIAERFHALIPESQLWRGKLGDQHKVPRVTNDRTLADDLLASAVTTIAEGEARAASRCSPRARDGRQPERRVSQTKA